MEIIKTKNEAELIKSLCELVERIASEAVASRGTFYLGVSGASLVKFLTTGLPNIKTEWSRWVIALCDERVVPVDSGESTFGAYSRELLPSVPLVEEQFLSIQQGVSCDAAAADYREKLRRAFNTHTDDYRFDLLLLGMGPDGHTCSLFPGHPLLDETELCVAPILDSPKPPPERVTLTYPVINRARNCAFALSGSGKADVVKRILQDGEDFPAGRVKPTDGNLYWILDESAASLLTIDKDRPMRPKKY